MNSQFNVALNSNLSHEPADFVFPTNEAMVEDADTESTPTSIPFLTIYTI